MVADRVEALRRRKEELLNERKRKFEVDLIERIKVKEGLLIRYAEIDRQLPQGMNSSQCYDRNREPSGQLELDLSNLDEDASFTDEVGTLLAEAEQKLQTNQDEAVRGEILQQDDSIDFKGETGASLVDQEEVAMPKT